ncbi:transcriptional regulator, MarR family [Bosea sp. OK403]|uniref:MarR family winged helix-turn-helix transcriptional regulator n=1 Tax=Bosea sp. OK403 TaxID=1855286 RepID=UPI0008E382B0|nr:MarR family winged helix-turn-helix transcriptional regulator [Bosea sp. OK403]SFJ71505.1 transcriptional regulator, MarR family [Bosea sp. OK403]
MKAWSATTSIGPEWNSGVLVQAQRAARVLTRRFDSALQPVGISSGQVSLLMSIDQAKSPSLGAIAALLAMDRTTLTANIKPLERRKLVKTSIDERDGRVRILALTPEGRTVLAEALPIWIRLHSAIEARLAEPMRLKEDLSLLSE